MNPNAYSGSTYQIKTLIREGAKFPLLVNVETGMPNISLVLYVEHVSSTLRSNSITNYLRDLELFQAWCNGIGVDPEERFMTLQGFSRGELRRLAQALMQKKSDGKQRCAYSTYNRRLAALASYCEFQMDRYLDRCGRDYERYNAGRMRKDTLLKGIRRLSVDGPEVEATSKATVPASEEMLNIFESILHPNSDLNPFHTSELKIRNYTMFCLALATWSRRAELVLLELTDLDLGKSPSIKFVRKPPKVLLKRNDGADLKTRAREIPITNAMKQLLGNYLRDGRPSLTAGHSPSNALFVSERDGARLSARTVNYILERASRAASSATNNAMRIHPHVLRATGATEFRKRYQKETSRPDAIVKSGELTDILTYIGGWSPSSSMPRRYTRQAIIERLRSFVQNGQKHI